MSIKLWNRAGVGIALIFITTLVVSILVQTGHVSAQKGAKLYPIELSATLRSDVNDGIYSDNPTVPYTTNRITASYPNNVILQEAGTLYMRIQKNRRVYFRFRIPSVVPSTYVAGDNQVVCREYSPDGISGKEFLENAPAFLTNGGDVTQANDITFITTGASVRYQAYVPATETTPATPAGWIEDASLPTIASMEVGPDPLYVWLSVRFDTIDDDESFTIHHNYELWTGLKPRTGIAMVTHTDVNTWVLVPLPPDDPAHPFRALGDNEASLSMVVGIHRKDGHSGGYCDLGYWVMPFELTLTRR